MTKRSLLRMLEREREAFAYERRILLEAVLRLAGHPTQVSDRELFYHEEEQEPVEPAVVVPDHYPE